MQWSSRQNNVVHVCSPVFIHMLNTAELRHITALNDPKYMEALFSSLDLCPVQCWWLCERRRSDYCWWPGFLSSVRGQTPPACDESTGANTHWRLQYDVYQYFLPENDLSERSLFVGFQAVADTEGMMASGRWVNAMNTQEMLLNTNDSC